MNEQIIELLNNHHHPFFFISVVLSKLLVCLQSQYLHQSLYSYIHDDDHDELRVGLEEKRQQKVELIHFHLVNLVFYN